MTSWYSCGPCALFLLCRISSLNCIFIIVLYCAMNHVQDTMLGSRRSAIDPK